MNKILYKSAAFSMTLLLAISSLFTSCKREPIEEDSGLYHPFDLVIKPRWIELDERPTGFTAVIYPTTGTFSDGSKSKTYTSNNVDSMVVTLPAGGYRVLIYNQTEAEYSSIKFRHMDSYYDSQIELADADGESDFTLATYARYTKEPAYIATDCCNELYVDPVEVDDYSHKGYRVRKVLTMKPHVIISTLYIKLRVKGVWNGCNMKGCIDGMAGSVFPVYLDAGDDLAAIPVEDTWAVSYDGLSSDYGWYTAKVRVGGMPGRPLFLTSGASIETQTYVYTRAGENEFAEDDASFTTPEVSHSEVDPEFEPEDIYFHIKVLLVDYKTVITKSWPVANLIDRKKSEPTILNLTIEEPMLELPYVQPANGSGASGFDADVDSWKELGNDIFF